MASTKNPLPTINKFKGELKHAEFQDQIKTATPMKRIQAIIFKEPKKKSIKARPQESSTDIFIDKQSPDSASRTSTQPHSSLESAASSLVQQHQKKNRLAKQHTVIPNANTISQQYIYT
ncbi:hypothetical protein Nepgr_023981 [Nepenthes gracilis]|uniref:Uncharacterized protein n=1 Tax=Nepenthes gracilis TaxID=150966 RepID=A0AAD3XYC9_NEPGR|nr:hypothetical protein Nepgr_023981 [Nepenthes gracilis]